MFKLYFYCNYFEVSISISILSRFLQLTGKNPACLEAGKSAKIKPVPIFTTDLHPWLQILHPFGVIAE